MKSNLKEGFALPFAVALIAIFTILFGSILSTASFYKKQKLIAIKKIELDELSIVGLVNFLSLHKSGCPQSVSEISGDIEELQKVCGQSFSSNINFTNDNLNAIFYLCSSSDNSIIVDSCAVSKNDKLSMKYHMEVNTLDPSNPSINTFTVVN
jgi:hypothetical protein